MTDPLKCKWEFHFVKVDTTGAAVVPARTFTCTIQDWGATSALQAGIDEMIDTIDPIDDAAFMRVIKMINRTFVKE